MADKPIQQQFVRKQASDITDGDIEKVVDKSEEIKRRFGSRGPLRRFIDDGRLLVSMVRDYWSRRYRQVPIGTIGAAVFTLLYVLDPLDLMPDMLPIIGQIDDAAVVAACLVLLEHDLRTYATWTQSQAVKPVRELPPPSAESSGSGKPQ